MDIEKQIKGLVRDELNIQLEEIESRFQHLIERELTEIRRQLSSTAARTEKIEGELSSKWNILVKLRRHTLDKLMSEYRKVENLLLPEKAEAEETAEI